MRWAGHPTFRRTLVPSFLGILAPRKPTTFQRSFPSLLPNQSFPSLFFWPCVPSGLICYFPKSSHWSPVKQDLSPWSREPCQRAPRSPIVLPELVSTHLWLSSTQTPITWLLCKLGFSFFPLNQAVVIVLHIAEDLVFSYDCFLSF